MTTNTTTNTAATKTTTAKNNAIATKADQIAKRIDECCKEVRNAIVAYGNARETLANSLYRLVLTYSKARQQQLIAYASANGKREKGLQDFGTSLKGVLVPTWFEHPELRTTKKRTLEQEKLFKRGMAEEKILTDTLPIVAALVANKAVEGASCDRAAGKVVLHSADKATKSARVALGVQRVGRKKGSASTASPSTVATAPSTPKPATDGVAAQARDERAIASANVTRLAGELTARLSSKDWGELAESARDALLTLAALISERHNESEQAKARQQNAKAS